MPFLTTLSSKLFSGLGQTLPPPSYSVSASSPTVDEGGSITWNITTSYVPAGTTLYYTITPIGDTGDSGGSFTVISGGFNQTVSNVTVDRTTEGSETVTFQLRTGGFSGTIVATASVTINDTSRTPTFTVTPGSISEGSSGSFTVNNLGPAGTYYWTILNGSTQNSDFSATSGSFTTSTLNGNGTFTVTPALDYTSDSSETFQVQIREGSTSGTVLVTSSSVIIGDTSATVTATASPTSISEGQSTTISVSSSALPTGTYYWTILNGTTTSADFSAASGSFSVSLNSGSFTVTAASNADTIDETFQVQIRADSVSGTVIATTGQITIAAPPNVTLKYTLNNPNAYSTSSGDEFGTKVAIDGNICIVGAPYEDDAGGSNSGKAYIFDANTSELLRTLDNPNAYSTSNDDQFGSSVAISGNYAIVGAPLEDDDSDGLSSGSGSGKAYIFRVDTGALVHTLNNPNPVGTSEGDNFGLSVAISGERCIVGAPLEDDNTGSANSSGKAYIFNVITGALLYTLNNPNPFSTTTDDQFGRSVSISGDRAIVGAPFEDETGFSDSGKAYIFNVVNGTLVYTLNNPNAYDSPSLDRFGSVVSISGNYAIVGAPYEDDAGGGISGKAYIFNVITGALVHTLNNPNAYNTSQFDEFGSSVAISGDFAIVGASSEDDAGGSGSGKAYIFDVVTGGLLYTINNPNAANTSFLDLFGFSVAISGNRCIAGAPNEYDSGGTGAASGKAYIFDIPALANSPVRHPLYVYDSFDPTNPTITDIATVKGAYVSTSVAHASNSSGSLYFDRTMPLGSLLVPIGGMDLPFTVEFWAQMSDDVRNHTFVSIANPVGTDLYQGVQYYTSTIGHFIGVQNRLAANTVTGSGASFTGSPLSLNTWYYSYAEVWSSTGSGTIADRVTWRTFKNVQTLNLPDGGTPSSDYRIYNKDGTNLAPEIFLSLGSWAPTTAITEPTSGPKAKGHLGTVRVSFGLRYNGALNTPPTTLPIDGSTYKLIRVFAEGGGGTGL